MGSVPENKTADDKGSNDIGDIVETIKSDAAAQPQAESSGANVDENNATRCRGKRP